MDQTTTKAWKKRTVVGAGAAAVALLSFEAAAWACTQRIGTFTVCEPPSTTYVTATCAKVTGTTQSGKVGGAGGIKSGEAFSARASSFKTKLYSVTFRRPNATNFGDCHRVGGVGTSGEFTQVLPDSTGATKFMGPSFYKTFVVPTLTTTGAAKICVQDVPDVVSGQVIDVTVV